MDAFYASIEQRDDPALRGRPVAVGGQPPRGVVAAASYEARPFGVHSAMPMAHALRRCPQLRVLPSRLAYYAEVSRRVFAVLRRYSPLVEPLSLDEAFIDLSGTERLHGPAARVARAIKDDIRRELQLVVSVGVGPNKFIAKIASDLEKPDGLCLVEPQRVDAFLRGLPVSRLFGVGDKTERKLRELGIVTIGELARLSADLLRRKLGAAQGDHLWRLARGIDERPVIPERVPSSIGHEDTFAEDIAEPARLEPILQKQADRVARRLRRRGLVAQVVVLKTKSHDFQIRTRRSKLDRPSCDGSVIGKAARRLLRALAAGGLPPLRLTGVSVSELSEERAPRQLTFDEQSRSRGEQLGHTLDRIADRFGDSAIVRASTLDSRDDPERG